MKAARTSMLATLAVVGACSSSRVVAVRATDASIGTVQDTGQPEAPRDVPMDPPIDVEPPLDLAMDTKPMDVPMDVVMDAPMDPAPDAVGACPAPALVGWATHAPGTTGGAGGKTMTVTTYDALTTAANSADALIIDIGTLIEATSTAQIRVAANKTIRGVAKGAGLSGAGFNIFRTKNVIIQNLIITKVMEQDAVTINQSTNVWIDHCDLSMSSDGLLDINHGSDWVTVSWNHLHDQQLTTLVGHTAAPDNVEDPNHLTVTYHHNWFRGTQYYNPKVRYGKVHVFNNFYDYPEGTNVKGIIAQLGAQVLVERNFFRNVKLPMTTVDDESSSDPAKEGAILSIENAYDGPGDSTITNRATWMPSPGDYAYTPGPADQATLPPLVSTCAGATLK